MEVPAKPENEQERLNALRSSQLLDTDKEAVFDNLTSLVKHVFNVPVAAISLVDEARQWFKSIQGLDVDETNREISFCAHVVSLGEPLIIVNAQEDERFYDNPMVIDDPYIVFYAGVPIRYFYRGKTHHIGTLCIIDEVPRSFSDDELIMLKRFAFQLEAIIEMRLPAQKFEQLIKQFSKDSITLVDIENNLRYLQNLSETDLLTDLPNRRYLDRLIKETWYHDLRKKSICLMMLDLDNFKNINDHKGHHVGDKVLKKVSTELNNLLRVNEDFICRFGGDEFVLITYSSNIPDIEAIANKILNYFSETQQDPLMEDITVSIGAYITSDKSHSLELLLKEADEQLYRAKGSGKNRFLFSCDG
jgi:diguanylate cyclase (GGDEF)-like protein